VQPPPKRQAGVLFTRHRALLLAVIVLFSLIRVRLLGTPLEPDEGEYAYAGQLLLQGIPPYQLAYNMKLPGTYAAYAAIFAVFGQSVQAIHLGLLLVNVATIILVAILGRRLYGAAGGLAAGACYALLSTSPSVMGFATRAEHFVALAAAAGALVLWEPAGKSQWLLFAGGVLMGTAMVMKQPGGAFIAFGAVYLAWKRAAGLPAYLAGAALPLGLTCLLIWRAGVFDKFWFWTVTYGAQYGTLISPASGLLRLRLTLPYVVVPSMWLWILAAVGVYRLAQTQRLFFPLTFLVFSCAAVSAGLFFRNHYFVMLLPAVSLLAGASVAGAAQSQFGSTATAVFVAAMGISIFLQRDYLFVVSPVQALESTSAPKTSAEAPKIGRYFREHSVPDSRIAVLGSEPQIYFYAGRHSATGYIYTYGLMEPQPYARRMQEEMIAEIEHTRPEYVVFVHSPVTWGRARGSDAHIFTWAEKYLATQYEPLEAASSPTFETFRRKTPAAGFPAATAF
jgi:hypothetical protein